MSGIEILTQKIETLCKKQDQMQKDIHFIKEKLFDPDEGLFSRVKDNTDFRKGTTTWLRLMGASIVGIITKMFYAMFTNGR